MENVSNDGTPKDEAMKANFNVSPESTKKRETKKAKKSAKTSPDEVSETSPEQTRPSLFKALGLDKIFEGKEKAEKSDDIAIAENYVAVNTPVAAEELSSSDPGTEDEVLAAASLAYLEALGEVTGTEQEFSEETLDKAAEAALEALGVGLPQETEPAPVQSTASLVDPKQAELESERFAVAEPEITVPKAIHHKTRDKAFSRRRIKAAKPVCVTEPKADGANTPKAVQDIENPQLPALYKAKVEKIHTAIVRKEILVREKAVTKFHDVTVSKPVEVEKLKLKPKPELAPAVEQKDAVLDKMVWPKQIDSMKLSLVLQVASEIKLDGVSLRTMYEKGSVDQKNLRFIIKQHLRGKRLEKIWPKPLSEKIISQELVGETAIELSPITLAGQAMHTQDKTIQTNKREAPLQNFQEPPGQYQEAKIQKLLNTDTTKPKKPYGPLLILVILALLIVATLLW